MSLKPLPKHIHLMGHKIKIVLNDDAENHGSCDWTSKVIYIYKNDDRELQESTLLHEALHMILRLAGIHNALDPAVEEMVVTALENGLYPKLKKMSW